MSAIAVRQRGSVPTIVVSTAATAEELFQKHDAKILDRPRLLGFDIITRQGGTISYASGRYWRDVRKMCISELFTAKRQASHGGIRADELRIQMKELIFESKQGRPINIKDWLHEVTTNNMTRMITNKRFFGQDKGNKDDEDINHLISGIIKDIGAFIIGDYVPYLRFVSKLQGWDARFNEQQIRLAKTSERVFEIDQHRQRARTRADDENFVPDFVDVLLQTHFRDGETLPDYKINLILADMLGAGTDTISTAVEWGLAELTRQPELAERARSELDSVVGNTRLVQESDLPNLPFLRAVVKENFRLHPPVAVNLPHEATEAFEFRGYRIPKQTRVLVNIYAIHRDPNVYQNPDDFVPDRFIARPDVDPTSGFDSYELTPFSKGRRMCPAHNLGNTMVTWMLANLLHCFNWSLPEGESLDMTEEWGLTMGMKSHLRLVATPRPPSSLY